MLGTPLQGPLEIKLDTKNYEKSFCKQDPHTFFITWTKTMSLSPDGVKVIVGWLREVNVVFADT